MGQSDLNIRQSARDSLKLAKELVGRGDDISVRQACLELRLCIEYLLLDRFRNYREFLDDAAMAKWTPKQIIEELLANDPTADTSMVLELSPTDDPAKKIIFKGVDRRLSVKWAKSNWQALSSFLHVPTLAQLEGGQTPTAAGMARKATEVAAHLDHVFDTNVENFVFNETIAMTCSECGVQSKRTVHSVTLEMEFACRNPKCGAIYEAKEQNGGFLFQLARNEISCPKCSAQFRVSRHLVKDRAEFGCPSCNTAIVIRDRLVAELPKRAT